MRVTIFLAVMTKAFIISRGSYKRSNPLHLDLFDSHSEKDIQIMDNDSVVDTLNDWRKIYRIENIELEKMLKLANKYRNDDIFIGHYPLYEDQRALLYIFYCKIMYKKPPTLFVSLCIRSPVHNASISSYAFKNSLETEISVIPIDWSPLLYIPKFKLSWEYASSSSSFDDEWDGDGL